jgi:hypothetical protein
MCAPTAVHLVDGQSIEGSDVLHRARWEAGMERKLEEA